MFLQFCIIVGCFLLHEYFFTNSANNLQLEGHLLTPSQIVKVILLIPKSIFLSKTGHPFHPHNLPYTDAVIFDFYYYSVIELGKF